MQPFSGNQRPALMNMSLVLRLPRKMHLSRFSSDFPRLPSFFEMLQNSTFCLFSTTCTIPCTCHAKRHLSVQKCSDPSVFCTFDFEMCFAPQRRALFRHLNFQKWSEHGVLCTFWLRNVLHATALCVAGVAQYHIHLRFKCRRGAMSHPPSFCVAGVAFMVLGGTLGPALDARDAAALCVAGVALSDIYVRFTWQAWHFITSTFVLRGRRDA